MDIQRDTSLDISATVAPSPDVLVQELDGEAVLLNLASERYFGLDDVGTRIWQHLLTHGRVDRVCREMLDEFDVDPDALGADVLRFVAELIEAGIVTVEAAGEHDPGIS
jgi:hypothetical protein